MHSDGVLVYEFDMRGHHYHAHWLERSHSYLVKNEMVEFLVKERDECGLGRLKVALKKEQRQMVKTIANAQGLDAPIIEVPGRGKGYIFAFNPKVRWAAACALVGL